MSFRIGQPVGHRIGDAFGKQGPAVELEQALLHHAPHQVGDVDLVDAVAEAAFEAVAVEQGEEELEVLLLAVVRGRRHQQEVARQAGQQPPELVALGVADFPSEERRRHLVRFVADHQVVAAVRGPELRVDVLVAGKLVQPGDGEIGLEEPVAGARRFELVVGQDVEREVEAAVELVLPLLDQASRADHQAALQVAARDQLLDQQPGHDRLAGAGVVGEQEAQRLARQHGFVHGGDLVRQRLHQGGVHREDGIEEVGQADAPGFGHEAVRRAVAVEAPGAALLDDFEAGFVVPVEDFLGDPARGWAVDEGKRLGAVPLHAYDFDRAVREDSAHGSVGLEFFELQGFSFDSDWHPNGRSVLVGTKKVGKRTRMGSRLTFTPLAWGQAGGFCMSAPSLTRTHGIRSLGKRSQGIPYMKPRNSIYMVEANGGACL